MKGKMKKSIGLLVALAVALAGISCPGAATEAADEAGAAQEYEIYPVPQDVTYGEGVLELGSTANLVIESAIDDATVNHLEDILEIKDISGSQSGGVVSGVTNFLVGTVGSGGAVDSWFESNVTWDEGFFDEVDAYVLAITGNTVAVLGKDTDAAFYGLSTLKLIMNQTEAMSIRELQVNDYAIGQYRGFIEGYYGLPWSVEDRISLMEFGSNFKMNVYMFAPKDDPYHNTQWRELYPDEELADIQRMVGVGNATKCRFVWSIHPFMNNPITLSNYDECLEIIKAKFQQLYDVGVRQFCISADDASSSVTLHAKLCGDMSEWVKAHEGTYNLIFVPQVYCTSAVTWSNWGGSTVSGYFSYFSDLDDVELMWTGEWVCHPATQATFDKFTQNSGKQAFMWLNWPVNDVNHQRLVMGPAEQCILNVGVTGFKGIVTNPLEQAEASKTALFAIADYAWNTSDFSCYTSWEAGFKYIDSGAPEALNELCKHLTNPSPGGITGMGESTDLEPYVTAFTEAYENGDDITESGEALIEQFEIIAAAADEFQANGVNENLKDEMKPWVDSLRYISNACIGYIKTAIALEENDAEAVCNNYISAVNNYKASQNCESPLLEGTQMVEAGAMVIMPFAADMDEAVEAAALEILGNDFSGNSTGATLAEQTLIYDGIGAYYSGSAANVTDGDDSTYAWFNQSAVADSYIGLDLGDVYRLDTIRIVQGVSNTSSDIFSTAVLEYSVDNENWTEIGTYSSTYTIEEDVLAQALTARYVRLRTPVATGKWYSIREFTVTTQPVEQYAYTNVEVYQTIPVDMDRSSASIAAVSEVLTLENGEYIGIEFAAVREITSITAEYTNADKLTLEYSYNGFEWYDVDESEDTFDARYIRIINRGEEAVTFTLDGISLENSNEDKTIIAEPAGEEGGEAAQAIDNSILTAFVAAEGSGSLLWRIDAQSIDSLYILQDAAVKTDAKVLVRTNTGAWVKAGELTQGMNVFENLLFYGEINAVKLEWEETGPTIYEMYIKSTERTAGEQLEKVIEIAETENAEDYTGESYSSFLAAIEEAKLVLSDGSATDEEREAALNQIYEAAGRLVRVSDADDPEPAKEPQTEMQQSGTAQTDGTGVLQKQTEATAEDTLKKGDTVTQNSLKYRVTDASAREVTLYGVERKKLKKVTIPATVTVKGESCKVTAIGNKALSGMKKLTTVVIGKNVKTIGKKAFFQDVKLKTITVKSKALTKVAGNALKKTYSKGTIKVPKSRRKAYAKLFKNRGQKVIK